ncbi:MAG: FtsW/RodA/SpoVE family cell cycle protein [Bacteroidia bacterium]|nr:FtsW/RodA/SpoVE family cell cycle protein [Bacteroidia bacterium]MDW8158459.1 FtsW/RodA/SpoVE family cell cycle protein [Bacteroidia bacterium]
MLKFKGDLSTWFIVFFLSLISLLAVYSSTSTLAFKYQGGDTEYYFLKHTLLIIMSLGVMYIVHWLDFKIWARISPLLLIASFILLLYTLFQGQEYEINKASRWINVLGQSFQPSDLAKFSLILYIARSFAVGNPPSTPKNLKTYATNVAITLGICTLIAPTNLSTAILIFGCSLALLFFAGAPLRYILVTILIGILVVTLLGINAQRRTTWKSRYEDYIARLFDPNYQPNYQTQHANIAIVNGGLLGKGAGKSLQKNFLPHPYSDFVYAIIIEEYGFLFGACTVLFLYILLFFRCLIILKMSNSIFGSLCCLGLTFMIVAQAMVNMGVTVGLLPVTGLTLPMISMGGTSLLFTSLSLGIILSISRKALEEKKLLPPKEVVA